MLQRQIFLALQQGTAAYASNESLYDELFQDIWLLSAAEVTEIKRYFRDNPICIVHGYPLRKQDQNPTIYILLTGEEQPQHAIGDAGGIGGAGTASSGIAGAVGPAGLGNLLTSSIWSHNYTLMCVALGTVQRAYWLYEVAKSVMLAAKAFFLAAPRHIDLVSYGGSDATPDMEHGPDILYIRNLQMRCSREYSLLDRASSLERYFKVDGIALPSDSPVAPSDALTLASTFGPTAKG